MQIQFRYGDKTLKQDWLPSIFEILYDNMSIIAPTGRTFEQDYAEWHAQVSPALEKDPRKVILIYDQDHLIGYFQYYVNAGESLFMMEEIQIRRKYHGTGVFQAFYTWFLPLLPCNIQKVEAYAHKKNVKSHGILTHLGLSPVNDLDQGQTVHYCGDFSALLKRFPPNNP